MLYPPILVATGALRLYPLYLTATINRVHATPKEVLLDLLVHQCCALRPEIPILYLLRAPSRPRLSSYTPFNFGDVCLSGPLHMRNMVIFNERWDSTNIISLDTLHFSDHLLEILVGHLLLLLVATIQLLDTAQGYA